MRLGFLRPAQSLRLRAWVAIMAGLCRVEGRPVPRPPLTPESAAATVGLKFRYAEPHEEEGQNALPQAPPPLSSLTVADLNDLLAEKEI